MLGPFVVVEFGAFGRFIITHRAGKSVDLSRVVVDPHVTFYLWQPERNKFTLVARIIVVFKAVFLFSVLLKHILIVTN